MNITTVLKGTTPLLTRNVRLADPDDTFARQISVISSKSKKTSEDRQAIARLEFLGGLYLDENGPMLPLANIRRCFVRAATVRRLGTTIERALTVGSMTAPLDYDGPRDAEELWGISLFRNRTSIVVGQKRVMRTRPEFRGWSITASWRLETSVMNLDDFLAVVNLAGKTQGLGDYRTGGYGRFETEVFTNGD